MRNYLFTVFTPTYNRAHTLTRVYQSLVLQTLSDFEWLIVDDGSEDETEQLINFFLMQGKINIRYFRQPNSGKHVAFNRAVREARGEFFLPFDSDDSCVPTALEQFAAHWNAICDSQREQFSGITCLSRNANGDVLGGVLPAEFIDGHPYEITSHYGLTGDKWGFHRTAILRDYPFPVFPGEFFVQEGLIWNRVGRRYFIRFVNEALHSAHYQPGGLSMLSTRMRMCNPRSTFLYYSEALDLPIRLRHRIRASSNLWRFSLHSRNWRDLLIIRKNLALIMAGLLPGIALALLDNLKDREC